jgi:hypothetical protein
MNSIETAKFKLDFFTNRIKNAEDHIKSLRAQKIDAEHYSDIIAINKEIFYLECRISKDMSKRAQQRQIIAKNK